VTEPADASAPQLWKDALNRDSVSAMAEVIARIDGKFDARSFVDAVLTDDFFGKELKARIEHIARLLQQFLPRKYSRAVKILTLAAPHLGGWQNWILTDYVRQFGLTHFDISVAALKELTQYGSSEFAIRPFVVMQPDRMLEIMTEWACDDNEHVRRLAAEGSRPRGVWVEHVEKFKRNPRPVLKLLEKLKADPSKYVRKAVANNLNDISKDHPDLVIKTALRWIKSKNQYTGWIVKHACRTLIKQGDARVFPLFGFTASPQLDMSLLQISKRKIKIGTAAVISAALNSPAKSHQKLAIDYKLHYVKANGGQSPKVFKGTEKIIAPGAVLRLSTRLSFADRTTRTHHPGRHALELVINGIVFGRVDFELFR